MLFICAVEKRESSLEMLKNVVFFKLPEVSVLVHVFFFLASFFWPSSMVTPSPSPNQHRSPCFKAIMAATRHVAHLDLTNGNQLRRGVLNGGNVMFRMGAS
jgi:hypothetical protein